MQVKADQISPDMFGISVEHIPDNLLLEPLEYIFADHCRQKDLCRALKVLVKQSETSDVATDTATTILQCLQHDLALHIADEEHDLFPRLRKRAKPADKIDDTLRLLGTEHERDRGLVEIVTVGLKQIAHGKPIGNAAGFRTAAEMLAEIHLSHLNWENTVVLELARLRLNDADRREMAQSMAARRGIDLPQLG